MSVALQFKLTQTGQAAVWNANNTGTSLNLTHIQFGSGNRAPSGTETALLNPQQAVAIAAGFSVSTTQIRMSAIFSGNQNYVVREVGLWAGDPAVGGSKLVGYWSQAAGDLAMKSPGVDFIFSHDMTLDAAVPAGSLTILADNAQSAMLAMITAHEAAANPHNQYATKAGVQAQTYTAFTTAGAAPTFTLTASPAIAAYAAGQRFRVKFGVAGNGADTLNVNALGAKSLKQYDATGAKVAAVIAANQLVDVEYDGVDFVLLDPLPNNPAGTLVFHAGATAPSGYLKANGSTISRTTYAALFAAIGTTFGAGDGATTFSLPDLRGEFLRGFDDGRGIDSGRTFGSSQAATRVMGQIYDSTGHGGGVGSDTELTQNGDGGLVSNPLTPATSAYWGQWITVAGSNSGRTGFRNTTLTRPRNVALLACIKY